MRMMLKISSLLLLVMLFACAPSMQSLTGEAELTGDWTLVSKRLNKLDERKAKRSQSCPGGTRQWCTKEFRHTTCSCVNNSVVRRRLDSMNQRQW